MNHHLQQLFTFVIDSPASYVPFSHPGNRWSRFVRETLLRFPSQQWTWISHPSGDPWSRKLDHSCKTSAWRRQRRGLAKQWRGRSTPWTDASACPCLICWRWRLLWKKKGLTRVLGCCRAAHPRASPGLSWPWGAEVRWGWRARTGRGCRSRRCTRRWRSPARTHRSQVARCPRGRGGPATSSSSCCRVPAWALRCRTAGQRWVLGHPPGSVTLSGSSCFSLILWVKGMEEGALFKEWMGDKNKHKTYMIYKLLETNSNHPFCQSGAAM